MRAAGECPYQDYSHRASSSEELDDADAHERGQGPDQADVHGQCMHIQSSREPARPEKGKGEK